MQFFKRTENKINKYIEFIYLGSILLVPIVFSPETFLGFYQLPKELILHLSGSLIFSLLVLKLIIDPASTFSKIIQYKAALSLLLILLLSTIISAIFSINPYGSFWGREYGVSGYSAHTIFSLIMISWGIIINSSEENHQKNILLTVLASTTIVSFLALVQNFIPAIFPTFTFYHQDRIVSTLGNPIYLGSFLLLGSLISIFYFLSYQNITTKRQSFLIYLIITSIQISGLLLTLSRGPIIGFIIGYLLMAISYIYLNLRSVRKILALFLLPFFISILIINIPVIENEVEYFDELVERTGTLSNELDISVNVESGVNIKIDPSSFNYRGENWISSAKIIRYWPRMLSYESQYFRSLFGYGPDTYVYTYPITVPIQERIVISNHAHNLILNTIVENGFVGLGILITLLVFIFRLLILGFRNALKDERFTHTALASILIARLLEQMLGLAVLPDLLFFYILLTLIIVIIKEKQVTNIPKINLNFKSLAFKNMVVISGLASAVLIFFLTLKDYNSTMGGFHLGRGLNSLNNGNIEEGIIDIEKASVYNPKSETIETEIFKISYKVFLYSSANPGTTGSNTLLLPLMYERLLYFKERNPYSFNAVNFLSKVTWQMAKREPDLFREEAIGHYVYLRNLMPNYLDVQEVLSNVLIASSYMEAGRQEVDLAILMAENGGFETPQSYWLKGEIEKFEGNNEKAIILFKKSIMQSEGIKNLLMDAGDLEYYTNSIYKFLTLSHQSLGIIYELSDDFFDIEAAKFHYLEAQKIARNSGNILLMEKRFH